MILLLLLKTTMTILSFKPVESESSPRSITAILAYRWPMQGGTTPPTEVDQFYLRNVNFTGKTSIVYTSLAVKGYVREYDLTFGKSTDLVSMTDVGPIVKGPNDLLMYCDRQNTGYIFQRNSETLTTKFSINNGITTPKPVAAMTWDPATRVIYAIRPGSQEGSLELLRVTMRDGKYTTIGYSRTGTVVGLEYYDTYLYIAVNSGSGLVDQVEINPTSSTPLRIVHSYHFPRLISINSLGVGKVDVQPPNNVSIIVHQKGDNFLSRIPQYSTEMWHIFQTDSHGAFQYNKNHPTFVSATYDGTSLSSESIFTITETSHRLNELYLS